MLRIYEPDLKSFGGHYLETALCIKKYLSEFVSVQIFGHHSVSKSLQNKFGIIPLFDDYRTHLTIFDVIMHTRFVWRIWQLYQFLSASRRKKSFIKNLNKAPLPQKGDLWFFPSPLAFEVYATIEFMENSNIEEWDVAFILRYPFIKQEVSALSKKIESSPVKSRIRLYSDSELLIEDYCQAGLDGIDLLPMPHLPEPSNEQVRGEKIVISYIGGARFDKGFNYLPDIINYLKEKLPDFGKLEFRVQCNTQDILSSHELKSMFSIISQLDKLGVRLYRDNLNSESYYEFFESSDIILLPYDNDKIQGRYRATSGILAEALALGKVVVVPGHTWLSAQVAKSCSGVVFENHSELNEKVLEAVNKYSELTAKASLFQVEWRNEHNIKRYCEKILEKRR